jgi:hypothetical protein
MLGISAVPLGVGFPKFLKLLVHPTRESFSSLSFIIFIYFF